MENTWTTGEVKFVERLGRVTCYGHDGGTCGYTYPHRLGSGLCAYREDHELCDACAQGYCEYHRYKSPYDPRDEAFTSYQRNE